LEAQPTCFQALALGTAKIWLIIES
jgi:hypothetical protein